MKFLNAGTSGVIARTKRAHWSTIPLNSQWLSVIAALTSSVSPRPVQRLALGKYKILETRRNLIIAAPTNSGKSLIGYLTLLEAITRGQRAVLIEPLRALAREKADELQSALPAVSAVLNHPLRVLITTGDYRLSDEVFASPPPAHGELIIATPERLDAILRNPANDAWVQSIGAVCVDEAHLLSSAHRGPVIEYLLTIFRTLPTPPRLILLSATFGNVERVRSWLAPCDAVVVKEREPSLRKEVWALDAQDDANSIALEWLKDVLINPAHNALIFVYQTRAAEKLADQINNIMRDHAQDVGAFAYHSKLSAARRDRVRTAFIQGKSRCLITTTALGLGVNLPASHVLVRDTNFLGFGSLGVGDLLQMMGRAGRGTTEGKAVVLVRPSDSWRPEELANDLRKEALPPLGSALDQTINSFKDRAEWDGLQTIASQIAAQLARVPEQGYSAEELSSFFENSLGGKTLARYVITAFTWLSDPTRMLAYLDESKRFRLSVLGLKATRAMLPLEFASGVGQLLRDLLSLDPTDRLLGAWRPLDHMLLIHLLYDRMPHLRSFSGALASQVDSWMEQFSSLVPILYREWIYGNSKTSHAIELLGSLGCDPSRGNDVSDAYEMGYLASFHSIVLYERSKGQPYAEIERRWGVKNIEGIEERWRDDCLWLLSGIVELLDIRTVYYHLREHCQADRERVQRVKHALRNMQWQVRNLQVNLKYCSPLGPLLYSMRTIQSEAPLRIGLRTIRRLEEVGIVDVRSLAQFDYDELTEMGIRPKVARQIGNYLTKRKT